MHEQNFITLFEKIGHIEASQQGIKSLLERIETNSNHVEERLQKVEKQTTKLMTLCSICACLGTIGLSLLTKAVQ